MITTCYQERGKGDQFTLGTKQPRFEVERKQLRRWAHKQAFEDAFDGARRETCLGVIWDAGLHPGLFPYQRLEIPLGVRHSIRLWPYGKS